MVKNLSSVMLLQDLFSKKDVSSSVNYRHADNKLREVVLKVFSNLLRINKQKGSTLVLVYLPNESYRYYHTKEWRQFMHDEAAKHNLLLIDLFDEFLKLPHPEAKKIFIRNNVLYARADGHYTKEGNAYIANALYKRIFAMPELSEKLRQKHDRNSGNRKN